MKFESFKMGKSFFVQDTAKLLPAIECDTEAKAQSLAGYMRNMTALIEKNQIRPLQREHADMKNQLLATGHNLIKTANAYEDKTP